MGTLHCPPITYEYTEKEEVMGFIMVKEIQAVRNGL